MEKKKVVNIIWKVSKGLAKHFSDCLIFYLFFTGAMIGKTNTSRGVWEAFREAEDEFYGYKYANFRNDLWRWRKKKYINVNKQDVLVGDKKKEKLVVEITELGKKRIESLLPQYQEERPWDKQLYLITYDISERRKRDRDLLRLYLRKIGCGMLQESVWLTPYNPKKILADFTRERYLSGQILVSTLGKDGAIGEYDLPTLMEKVFHLSHLSERYEEFIAKYSQSRGIVWQLKLDFLSILKDDPQLPFELLPENFPSKRAYEIFKTVKN